MRVIGLTGGIATGKSTAAGILRGFGAFVIDADQVAHQVTAPGEPAVAAIARQFGPEFVRADGSIDRARLAGVVFADDGERQKLNAIIHPLVRAKMQAMIGTARESGELATVLDVPLLVESGGAYGTDEVWLVYVPEPVQIERLMSRNKLTREEAMLRIAAQMPIEEKRRYADVVLDNTGDVDALRRQLAREWQRFTRAT